MTFRAGRALFFLVRREKIAQFASRVSLLRTCCCGVVHHDIRLFVILPERQGVSDVGVFPIKGLHGEHMLITSSFTCAACRFHKKEQVCHLQTLQFFHIFFFHERFNGFADLGTRFVRVAKNAFTSFKAFKFVSRHDAMTSHFLLGNIAILSMDNAIC